MFNFAVTGIDEFRTWLYTVKGRYSLMLQAMIDTAEVIKAETLPLTPYKTGQLGESFQWTVLEYSRNFIEVEVKMDAVDPNNGFHYAEYQHNKELVHPPPRAGQQYYLREGIYHSESMVYELIETDYLSLFEGIKSK